MHSNRNPFAKAVTRKRPQIIPDKRRRIDSQIKREIKEDAGDRLGSGLVHTQAQTGSTPVPATAKMVSNV